jgi:hypothetical protein
VEISAATRCLAGEQLSRRLIGSIVDDYKLADWVGLRVNCSETSFKERRTVPRYDDCRYNYHERRSLIYKSDEIILTDTLFFFRRSEIKAKMNHVTAHLVKQNSRRAAS